MPIFYQPEQDDILKFWAVTLFYGSFTFLIGLNMTILHLRQNEISMAMIYDIETGSLGLFLVGLGSGLLVASGIAHLYNRKEQLAS